MVRSSLTLIVCLISGGAAWAGSAEDNYKQFLRSEIASRWSQEKLSQQRVVMVRGFARHDLPAAAKWLLHEAIAKDPAADVVYEAVQTLAAYKNPATIEAFAALWKKFKKPVAARALALTAFGPIKHQLAAKTITRALKDREPYVLIAACHAASQRLGGRFREALLPLLKHKHRGVRGAALTAFAGIGDESVLPQVFQSFVTDPSPRVRFDAWLTLKSLSLQNLPCDPASWDKWWQKSAADAAESLAEGEKNPWGAKFPRINAQAGLPGRFFGIPVLGKRIVFMLDVSINMDDPWPIDIAAERKKPKNDRIPNFFGVKTRWDLCHAYLNVCLKSLPETTEVGFVFFNSNVVTYPQRSKFFRNTSKNRAKALLAAREAKRGSSTAMYEAFQKGWGFLKDGHEKQNFQKGPDTLVFLTDGTLSDGELKNQPERLKAECWKVALLRNLRIHIVGLYNHDFDLCRCIAWKCQGLYFHAQPQGDKAEPQHLDFWPAQKKAWQAATKKIWKNKVKHCG